MKTFFKEILLCTVGTFFCGLGTGAFLLPNKLSSGGFSGIATILYYYFGWNVGVTIVLLNIPLFVIAFLKIGKKFLIKTFIGTFTLSIFIEIFSKVQFIENDRFLACIYGGILIGFGTGLVFRANTSTGGSDLIVQILKAFKIRMTSSRLLHLIDIIVVTTSVVCFKKFEIGLYSAITIFLDRLLIDIIFEGINFSKMIFIISDKKDEVLKCLHDEINCGATQIYGNGSYSDVRKTILMSVVNRRDVFQVKEKIKKIDSGAFIIITNAREVYGLGFKSTD